MSPDFLFFYFEFLLLHILNFNFLFSVTLPARFVMKLNRPMPMSLAKCREIAQLTEINFFDEASASPLIQLIVKNASNNKLDSANNRGLFVVS